MAFYLESVDPTSSPSRPCSGHPTLNNFLPISCFDPTVKRLTLHNEEGIVLPCLLLSHLLASLSLLPPTPNRIGLKDGHFPFQILVPVAFRTDCIR